MERIKDSIVHYWSHRAPDFARQRVREFESDKRELWLTEFNRYLPKGKPLRVLDLGTGTGFFAFLLSAEGHQTTGIDLTEEMIQGAKRTASILGLGASFQVMDAERPEYPPESFDVLVSRNLTWTLPRLDQAYQEWYKLLAPGGVLINFDADYCRAVEEGEETELPPEHAHMTVSSDLIAMNENITMELSAYQQPRPQWDVQLLVEAGFERICVDMGVARRIYHEIDEFYNPTPIFTVVAYK